jgi:hypothetical protein
VELAELSSNITHTIKATSPDFWRIVACKEVDPTVSSVYQVGLQDQSDAFCCPQMLCGFEISIETVVAQVYSEAGKCRLRVISLLAECKIGRECSS